MITIKKSSYLFTSNYLFIQILCLTFNHSFAQRKNIQIVINPSVTYQKIEHFGASDAWACQFVGEWQQDKKQQIADLLFSMDTLKNGQPQGIGLSLWRFNIGAGSTEQGEKSGIKDPWRRAESFMDDNGNYDWNRQKGQIWFLNAAKQRNVPKFLAFSNSPPVQFTTNKRAFASEGKPNLDSSKFDNFSTFLCNVIVGIKEKTGVLFDYISPVNEPQWKWSDGNQEGSPFTNHDIVGITKSLSTSLIKANLLTQINISEAGQIDYLYKNHNNPPCGNQVFNFFQSKSPLYIGGLPNVINAISGHSYFTTSPIDTAIFKRKQLQKSIKSVSSLRYWMSEYCILGGNDGEIEGNKKDLGIEPALYLAKTIHNDLVYANATSWSWWTALSAYDYKDGLIYVDKSTSNGNFYPSKMLWALGNYARFIRPDATRIIASLSPNDDAHYLVSAYKNTDNKIVVVIINAENHIVEINLLIKNQKIETIKTYSTSASDDLKASITLKKPKFIRISPHSIITLVVNSR